MSFSFNIFWSLSIQADPLLFQILNSNHLWMNVNPNHRCEILKNINSLMFARNWSKLTRERRENTWAGRKGINLCDPNNEKPC
jgi:hypothetical protein